MLKKGGAYLFLILFQGLILPGSAQNNFSLKSEFSAYNNVNPVVFASPKIEKPVLIAIIDDGFRLSHKDFRGLIYENPKEKDANHIDDDGNRKPDDYQGWDIADKDNNVLPPEGLENSFYHGTFITSTVINVLKMCFPDLSGDMVNILPVKVLSDFSTLPDYSKGYEGIEYAIEQKADIICCAWSGGEPSREEKAIVERAIAEGIIVIGSAGNAYSNSVDPPGSLPGILTVGGVDSMMRKTPYSNYGLEMDLVAPAQKVKGAFPLADNSYFMGEGTSAATGIICGCAAVLKILNPKLSADEIKDALINTSIPLDKYNPGYAGRMGAGIPDLKEAAKYVNMTMINDDNVLIERTKGRIYVNKKINHSEWIISPYGSYHGFWFKMKDLYKPSRKGQLSFYTLDSLWYESDLKDFPGEVFVPGNVVKVEYRKKKFSSGLDFKLEYFSQPIDSTIVYCSDTRHYRISKSSFSDGSGSENYANNCACKWQITAPEGKRIMLEFEEFSTQAKIDFVYFFEGESTIPDNMIAKFSGPELPMNITSRTNKILVWFVTDGSISAEGWTLKYSFID